MNIAPTISKQDVFNRLSTIKNFSQEEQNKLKTYLDNLYEKQGIDRKDSNFSSFAENYNFYNVLGDFCQHTENYIKAIAYYKEALNINQRNYWANLHIAKIYSRYVYTNKASELNKERHILIKEISNIYDYLIAITFKNKKTLNSQEETCLRSASYFFDRVSQYSKVTLINRLLAKYDKLFSADKYFYKPVDPFEHHGVQMNPFYEKFALVLEDRSLVNNYRLQYAKNKQHLNSYLIAITPRSGSSWLTELIYKTKLAGNPDEWFNQENLDGILDLYPCKNLQDYLKCIKIAQSTSNNVFGLETSFYQLKPVLETMSLEQVFCPNFKSVYLTRNDFIRQGISLYKAVTSTYYHTSQTVKSVKNVSYDASQIKYWILHILHQEFFWENLFSDHQHKPLRVTYEKLVENPELCVKNILSHIGIDRDNFNLPVKTEHKKISNSKNEEMYEQFKRDNIDFIKSCERSRNTKDILEINAV